MNAVSNSDLLRYVRWLLARSDVETALSLIDRLDVESCEIYLNYIKRYWPGYFSAEDYANVYSEAGIIEARNQDAFHQIPSLDRFRMIYQVMASLGDCKTVLDFGCSRGLWDIHLHNHFGKRWLLYDIDRTSIEEARRYVKAMAKDPAAFEFEVAAEEGLMLTPGSVDCVLLLEVLEHVRDPMKLLQKLEGALRPNGFFILSVPFGPMEYTMWVEHPERRREHLREFGFQDLLDILRDRPGFYLQYVNYNLEKYTKLPIGHFVVVWRKSDYQPLGSVDWRRKQTVQIVSDIQLPGML